MKDEGQGGFDNRQTDEWTNRRTDICDCRVAFATEKLVSEKNQDNASQNSTALKAFKKFKEEKDKKINAGKKGKALVIPTFYVFYTRFVFPEGKSEPRCNEARQTIS